MMRRGQLPARFGRSRAFFNWLYYPKLDAFIIDDVIRKKQADRLTYTTSCCGCLAAVLVRASSTASDFKSITPFDKCDLDMRRDGLYWPVCNACRVIILTSAPLVRVNGRESLRM